MSSYLIPIDAVLITLYRLTGIGLPDFLIGTFILAFIAVVIGELTISVLFLINREHIEKITEEVIHYRNLSMDALAAGNKAAYKGANGLANDAFGKSFFLQIALSAGFVWPAVFAVIWMGYRFSEVRFEVLFTNYTVSYICPFVAMFVAAYLVFKKIKYKIPYFRRIKTILDNYERIASPREATD
jgi:hypothetical protein